MQHDSGVRIVALLGEIDVGSVRALRAELAGALDASRAVHVDLSAVRTIDSAGIRELLRAQALAVQMGKVFGVIAPAANVRRLLDAARAGRTRPRARLTGACDYAAGRVTSHHTVLPPARVRAPNGR